MTTAAVILSLAYLLRVVAPATDAALSARPLARYIGQMQNAPDQVAIYNLPRGIQYGLAFYRNQVISNYQTRQIPPGEHIVVAARGFQRSIARESGRKVTYLGNFAPQQLEYFYVAAH